MRDEAELKFEKKLCNYLCSNERNHKWQYLDVNTTKKLWDNFKKILNSLNKDKLNHPLTNTEFDKAKKRIQDLNTPYDAGKFIYGFGGKCQIPITDDDGNNIYLTVFDKNNTQDNHYQLAKQVRKSADNDVDKDSRFDITLLINGLPILQIEEKKDGVDSKTAVRQMHEYIHENKYSGIFSTLQILIAMTPHDIWYMANSTDEDFNEDFAFRWKKDGDDSNKLLDWKEFCDSFLNPSFAYEMATQYTILDASDSNPSLKVMRYYQVYATRNILSKLKKHNFEDKSEENKKVGYVWHTTGSGKTISSYKVAFLASRLPKVKRVIFAVDRVVLTAQTYNKYKAYLPEEDAVMPAKNGTELKNELENNSASDIVVCGLKMLAELFENNPEYHIDDETVVIVDEAHRSTKGDQVKAIKRGLTRSAWIGFTGTPDFDEDKDTTEDIFGPKLHVYTIKDAIQDKNVLGFNVEFERTFDEYQYVRNYVGKKYNLSNKEEIDKKVATYRAEDIKKLVNEGAYSEGRKEVKSHIEGVVSDILSRWNYRSNDRKFNAILTVNSPKGSSKMLAYDYYQEFRKQLNDAKNNNDEDIPTDLKIAMTFSYDGTHNANSIENNTKLKEVLNEYNREFGTNYGANKVNEYFNDLTSRLDKTALDGNYLDLVIVVDQLLTGFDAPQLNTLYVDRIMEDSKLIQAYSRTNRIYDMVEKPFGIIVNYKFPELSEKYMNKALEKFSNSSDIDRNSNTTNPALVPSYEFIKNELKTIIGDLADLTGGFTEIPETEDEQEKAYKKILKYNRLIKQMMQYDEYTSDDSLYKSLGINENDEKRLTGSIFYDIKNNLQKHSKEVPYIDVTSNIQTINHVNVDVKYIKDLLSKYVNNNINGVSSNKDKQFEIKNDLLSTMGKVLNSADIKLIIEYMSNPGKYSFTGEINSDNVLDKLHNILDAKNNDYLDNLLDDFISEFCLQGQDARKKLKVHVTGMDAGHETNDIAKIRKEGLGKYFTKYGYSNQNVNERIEYVNSFRAKLNDIKKKIKGD